MSYMPQKDNSITMRVNSDFKVDIFNLFAIIYEIDLYKNWLPFCQESKTVKKFLNFFSEVAVINKTTKVASVKVSVGKFFFKRQGDLIGYGWNRLIHRDCITIETTSIEVKFT